MMHGPMMYGMEEVWNGGGEECMRYDMGVIMNRMIVDMEESQSRWYIAC